MLSTHDSNVLYTSFSTGSTGSTPVVLLTPVSPEQVSAQSDTPVTRKMTLRTRGPRRSIPRVDEEEEEEKEERVEDDDDGEEEVQIISRIPPSADSAGKRRRVSSTGTAFGKMTLEAENDVVVRGSCSPDESRMMADLNRRLWRLEKELKEKNDVIATQQLALEEKEEEVREKNLALKEKEKEMKEKDRELKERDRSVKQRDKELKEKEKAMKEMEKELKERDKEGKEREKEWKEKDKEVKEMEKELKEKDKELRLKEKIRSSACKKMEAQESELEELRAALLEREERTATRKTAERRDVERAKRCKSPERKLKKDKNGNIQAGRGKQTEADTLYDGVKRNARRCLRGRSEDIEDDDDEEEDEEEEECTDEEEEEEDEEDDVSIFALSTPRLSPNRPRLRERNGPLATTKKAPSSASSRFKAGRENKRPSPTVRAHGRCSNKEMKSLLDAGNRPPRRVPNHGNARTTHASRAAAYGF